MASDTMGYYGLSNRDEIMVNNYLKLDWMLYMVSHILKDIMGFLMRVS